MKDQISITELRANLRAVLQKVKRGNTISITDHGSTIAEINPPKEKPNKEVLKEIEKIRLGSKILGDIVSPTVSDDEILLDWNNLQPKKKR